MWCVVLAFTTTEVEGERVITERTAVAKSHSEWGTVLVKQQSMNQQAR